jgi:hypothetical protein
MKRRSWPIELPHIGEWPFVEYFFRNSSASVSTAASSSADALTLSISPERPCVFWFHRPWRPARRGLMEPRRRLRHQFQLGIRHHHRHLDDPVAVRIEPGHFHVQPDEVVCVACHIIAQDLEDQHFLIASQAVS